MFTAEVRSESEREDSEGGQTARETRELVKDPLETPAPSRALPALVKPTRSELCDRLRQKKREEMGGKDGIRESVWKKYTKRRKKIEE